jgi:hypothetical protein
MYIADLFNSHNLFQTFGGWFRDVKVSFFSGFMRSKEKDLTRVWEKWKQNVQIFEILLGFATSTILTLNQIKTLEQKCINQYKGLEDELEIYENRIIFWSHKLVNLLSKIPLIINKLIIMEDLLLQLISKKIGNPLPKHFYILIKNGHVSYKFLSEEVWNILEQYWNETGKYLRSYRNLDYYLFSLTTHAYLEVEPKEKIVILLPDNPEIEDIRLFRYEQQLDAIRFLEKAFENFHNIVEMISASFNYSPTHILQGWSFISYEYLPAKKGTVALVVTNPEKNKAIEVINVGGKPYFNKLTIKDNDEGME